MIKRKWPILVILPIGAAAIAMACSETGPDADPRMNGCIGQDCNTIDGGFIDGAAPPADAPPGTDAPPGGFPDPLEGTSKTATLVKGGFQFAEGPVWIDGRLIFSDINGNAMHELLGDGGTRQFRGNSGAANGNAVDPQGRLVTCEGNGRKLVRTNAQLATPTLLADVFGGKFFNSPNDVIVRKDGNVYFTDPDYGPAADGGQDDEAVYRLAPGAAPNAATRLAFDFAKPNGIALSTDGNTLYVVDNGDGRLLGAQLNPDGSLGSGFSKVADTAGGDGMAVDDADNLYVAATAGILVFDKTGQPLGTVTVPGSPTNCAFGGADRKTLYITSNTNGDPGASGLYSIRLNVPGLP